MKAERMMKDASQKLFKEVSNDSTAAITNDYYESYETTCSMIVEEGRRAATQNY